MREVRISSAAPSKKGRECVTIRQAGGTVLVVAFLISVIQQKLAPQPNWKKAIIDLVWFTFLLTSYTFVAGTLMRTVLSFGGLDPGAIAASGRTIFVDNLQEFADFQKNQVMEESTLTLDEIFVSRVAQ